MSGEAQTWFPNTGKKKKKQAIDTSPLPPSDLLAAYPDMKEETGGPC